KGKTGFGVEAADFNHHVEEILLIHPAEAFEALKVSSCKEVEIPDQDSHGRIEPVTCFQLQREAFRQVLAENARRIEGLALPQCLLHPRNLDAEPCGDFARVTAKVAGF